MKFRNFAGTGLLASILFLISAVTAFAAPATATSNVNVRTGPSTAYVIVDVLAEGERVQTGRCQAGWCYVEHDGSDGWVSARYLSTAPAVGATNFPLEIAEPTLPVLISPIRPTSPRACVYTITNFLGVEACHTSGEGRPILGPVWNDNIASIRIYDGAEIVLCRDALFGGFCRTITRSERRLGKLLRNEVSAYRVR